MLFFATAISAHNRGASASPSGLVGNQPITRPAVLLMPSRSKYMAAFSMNSCRGVLFMATTVASPRPPRVSGGLLADLPEEGAGLGIVGGGRGRHRVPACV